MPGPGGELAEAASKFNKFSWLAFPLPCQVNLVAAATLAKMDAILSRVRARGPSVCMVQNLPLFFSPRTFIFLLEIKTVFLNFISSLGDYSHGSLLFVSDEIINPWTGGKFNLSAEDEDNHAQDGKSTLYFFSVVGDDNTYGLICVSTLSFSLYFRFVLWSLLLTLSFLLYKKSLYYTLYIS